MSPSDLIDELYEPGEALGAGGHGAVSRARVRATGEAVAIKRVAGDGPARALLRHEYAAMRRLEHPGLVRAIAYHPAPTGDALVMEVLDGPGVPAGPLPEPEAAALLAALCRPLAYLHAQGLVHGDVKAENARFDAAGRLRLLDLGFLQQAGRPGARRGTLAYMAPEVIRGEPADPRSDVYAVGVLAYELLVGRPPYPPMDPLARLAAQEGAAAPSPRDARPDLSPALADLVAACLAAPRGRRPPTAAHVLARLGGGEADLAAFAFGSELFGRDDERARLRAGVAAQLAGEAGPNALVGPAGVGKSRLLTTLLAPDADAPALLVAGRGDVPLRLATDLLAAAEPLMAERGLAPDDEAWRPLRALAPAWGEPPPPLDPLDQEGRLRQALAALLRTLAAAGGLVIAIDDWDQADAASRALLEPQLAAAGEGPAWVLAVRQGPPPGATALEVGPLAAPAVRALIDAALGEEAAAPIVELALARSQGSPGRVRDLLGHWLRAGVIRRAHGTWELVPEQAAAHAEDLGGGVDRLLAGLSADATRLARAAATLGQATTLADLAALVEPDDDGDAFAALGELEAADVLVRTGDRLQFLGLAWEGVRAATEPAEARAWHARAARRFADDPSVAGRTQAARHLVAAGDPAAPAAVLAAAQANLAFGALGTAHELLAALAAEALPPGDREEALRLAGDVARTRGEGDAALASYGRAIALARELGLERALARELVSAARVAVAKSRHDEAEGYLTEALALADRLGDHAQRARALTTVGRRAFFVGEVDAARAACAEAAAVAGAVGETAIRAYALGFLATLRAPDDPQAAAELEEAIALNRGLQNPVGLIDNLINLGDRRLAGGDLRGAEPVFREVLGICRQIGAFNEEAFAHLNLAQTYLERGALADAARHAALAEARADALGLDFPAGYALAFAAQIALKRGEFAAARDALAAAEARAAKAKNRYLDAAVAASAALLAVEAGERAGERADAAMATAEAIGDPVGQAFARWLQARARELEGRPAEAAAAADDARARAEAGGARLVAARARATRARLARAGGAAAEARELATAAREAAEALGADEVAAEASWVLGELALAAGDRVAAADAFAAVIRFGEAAPAPLWEALGRIGRGRADVGLAAAEERGRGERALRALRDAAGPGAFGAWPERQVASAGGADAATPLASQAFGMLADLRRADDLDGLIGRLLDRVLDATDAAAGGIFTYDGPQLEAYVLRGLGEDVLTDPGLTTVLFDGRPMIEGGRWAFPATDRGALRAVLYLADAPADRLALAAALADGIGSVIGMFTDLDALRDRTERLAFSRAIAELVADGGEPAAQRRAVLAEALRVTGGDRAFLLLPGADGELATVAAVDAEGRPLPADAVVSRGVCDFVRENREPIRLMDAQSVDQWRNRESIMALGLRTIAAVPVAAGDDVGVLYVDSADVLRMLGPRELGLLGVGAGAIARWLGRP